MDNLYRSLAPISDAAWAQIEEEAARTLGCGPVAAFFRVTLPRLKGPMVAAGLLVFIAVVKELPLNWMLAPTGWRSLSTTVFGRTVEGMMAEAAPFALAIILFSALFVGLILKYEGQKLNGHKLRVHKLKVRGGRR